MKIQAAIFDMDGLMFDTERLFLRAFREEITMKTGERFPEDKLMRLIGLNKASAQVLFAQMFPEESYDECISIELKWVEAFIQAHGLPVKPGLFPLLEHLCACGIPIAVASSSQSPLVKRFMVQAGVMPYLKAVIGGDMVRCGKPDPEIFLRAAASLGVAPQDCVVFEDSKNGLLAAHAGGFPCVVVPDLKDPTVECPGLCWKKLENLAQAIPLIS